MAFHRAYEMPLAVSRKKLAVNNMNVFACVKDHKFAESGGCLFSGACLEEFLEFLGLSGRKICSDSHMHKNRLPLGGRELTRAAGHMAAAAIKRPQLGARQRLCFCLGCLFHFGFRTRRRRLCDRREGEGKDCCADGRDGEEVSGFN